jgi:hypothetical protein
VKVRLLNSDRDFVLEPPASSRSGMARSYSADYGRSSRYDTLTARQQALLHDLTLETLFSAMAAQDGRKQNFKPAVLRDFHSAADNLLLLGSRFWGRLREQGLDVPVEHLDFLGQDVVAGFLAEEHQELTDGTVDQLPLLSSGLPRLSEDRFCRFPQLQRLHGGFHQPRCDFAVTGQFHGALPGHLRLFRGQADHGPELSFAVGFALGTSASETGEEPRCRDEPVRVMPTVIAFGATEGLEGWKLDSVDALVPDPRQRQAELQEGLQAGADECLTLAQFCPRLFRRDSRRFWIPGWPSPVRSRWSCPDLTLLRALGSRVFSWWSFLLARLLVMDLLF